ncbi:MAG: hypothetical protein ACQR33_04470 [Candidatus Saccharibacteria bacterium]
MHQAIIWVVILIALFFWLRSQWRKAPTSSHEVYQDVSAANSAHVNPTVDEIVTIGEHKEQKRNPAETQTVCAALVREGKLFEVIDEEGRVRYSTLPPNKPSRWW